MKGAESMRHFRTGRRRSFQFESLESRRVMAGNIDLLLNSSGVLFFTGDGAANAVEVAGNGNPGEVIITPLQGTTLTLDDDPATSGQMLLTGVTGLDAAMGA